jgi:hypothetical protein
MTETETAMFVVVVERGLLKVRGILATGGGQRLAASGPSGGCELGALDYKMAVCARHTCPPVLPGRRLPQQIHCRVPRLRPRSRSR